VHQGTARGRFWGQLVLTPVINNYRTSYLNHVPNRFAVCDEDDSKLNGS